MKKYSIVLFLLMSACSSVQSTKELQASPKCMVWKDGFMGGGKYVAEVEGELAKQKQTCWVMNMFACTYTDYTYRSEKSPEILSSIGDHNKTIGKLVGNQLSIEMTGLKVDPFVIEKGKAEYTFQGPIGPKQSGKVEYNQSCTTRQVALGIMTIIGK